MRIIPQLLVVQRGRLSTCSPSKAEQVLGVVGKGHSNNVTAGPRYVGALLADRDGVKPVWYTLAREAHVVLPRLGLRWGG